MTYADIQTEFVKQEMRKTAWKNRAYIDNLMLLERFALGEVRGWAGSMYAERVKGKYKTHYDKICKELKAKGIPVPITPKWGGRLVDMI